MDKYELVTGIERCFHCNEHHECTTLEPASDPEEDQLYYLVEDVDAKINKIATLFQKLADELGVE